ncbi:hypothetical protein fugu_012847 [Takifugu bimaculatus]|uniref:Radial spoke head protein 3 homolog n=1 Tax=Takifugu bimaculatus TaxID=433685 RepID=A0A4Z2C6I9_9TELE|nr:hypothetical protein fugu_012847 [Takifugu bimaculatus]
MAFVSYNQMEQNRSYTFLNRPRPVESRPIYRKPSAERTLYQFGNITYDRRVVRGNVFAQNIISATKKIDPTEIERPQTFKRRSIPKQPREQIRSVTPDALRGRTHNKVQTESYLEALSDVIVTSDQNCETEALLNKSSTPLFIPAKSGKDVETQIEEGELFDFDREVVPLLEVLVGKVLEQSLLEVMEEEELAYLKAQQRAFEELRNSELAEVQRLQEQERRRREEKERRIAQQREVLRKEREIAQKMAARAYTKEYMSGLLATVFTSLRADGYFFDPIERDIESNFLPWLMSEVVKNVEKKSAARELLDSVIFDLAELRLERLKELETQTSESE